MHLSLVAKHCLAVLSFPTPLSDIKKFEECNAISINVFGWENSEVFPSQITNYRFEKHVTLLSHGERRHYCLIKDMSRLLGVRWNKTQWSNILLNYCLHGFRRHDLLEKHIPYCSSNAPQKVSLPGDDDKWPKFKSHAKGLKVPFTIYDDFECFLQKTSQSTTCTEKYQKHIPSGFCYTVVSSVDKYNKPAVVYRGENVMDEFMKCLEAEKEDIVEILSHVVPMNLSNIEQHGVLHVHIIFQRKFSLYRFFPTHEFIA